MSPVVIEVGYPTVIFGNQNKKAAGQRQIFLRELRMKACMMAVNFARYVAQNMQRQLSDIAICR